MGISALVFVVLATLVANCQAAYLRIIEAGVLDGSWTPGPKLNGTISLCPEKLFYQFTVECVPDATGTSAVTWARFDLNGVFYRQESVGPFLLTGEFLSQPLPWETYPSTAFIECTLSNGEQTSATILFSCSAAAIAAAPVAPPANSTSTEVPVEVDIGEVDDDPDVVEIQI